jgi:ABC-type antimicrobial peptide transport system ATPase subunit
MFYLHEIKRNKWTREILDQKVIGCYLTYDKAITQKKVILPCEDNAIKNEEVVCYFVTNNCSPVQS